MITVLGCHSNTFQIASQDGNLVITCIEPDDNMEGITIWSNEYKYKFNGKWYKSTANALESEYYDGMINNIILKSELETGIYPIRIDQIVLSDYTPIYLVYAIKYEDTAYHDYYYSYTALCIKDGMIKRYPLFKDLVGKEGDSNYIIITPASVDFDFTNHSQTMETDLITNTSLEDRFKLDHAKKKLTIYDEGPCFRFVEDYFIE